MAPLLPQRQRITLPKEKTNALHYALIRQSSPRLLSRSPINRVTSFMSSANKEACFKGAEASGSQGGVVWLEEWLCVVIDIAGGGGGVMRVLLMLR